VKGKTLAFYILKKALLFLLSLLLLSLAVFFASRLAPGDPLASFYGDRAEQMSPQQRAWAQEKLGLNDPLPTQYLRWLKGALSGDFGISFKYKQPVTEVIAGRIGNTLLLGGVGCVLLFLLALGFGLLCARFEDRWPDRLLCKAGTVLSCIPQFWLSLLLILVFSVCLGWLPSSGAYALGQAGSVASRLRHLILPLAVVVLGHLWYYAYMIRNKLLEEVRSDYVLLAKSTGLSRQKILLRHCLGNILPSYLSIFVISLPHVLGGTYIVETVFSYPGIGTLAYESARYRDYNLLMLLCLLTGAVVILTNMLVQIINVRIDPRTGWQGEGDGYGR